MTAALILLAIAAAANLIIWGTIIARHSGVRTRPLTAHPGRHAAPRPVNGRNLGDQPRADQRPGRQPWLTAGQPVLPAPPLPHAYDPGDGILPPVPLARPYVAACTDAETLAMYRGDWGTMPAERIIAAELPQVIA